MMIKNDKRYGGGSRKMLVNILIYAVIAIVALRIAFAIPNTLTLQGKLTNAAGASLSGSYTMVFRIYDIPGFSYYNISNQTSEDNTAITNITYINYTNILWEDNRTVTTDANGIYDVMLSNLSKLNFSDQYYLGITVMGDNESVPRINLSSSPYAFRANISEGLNRKNKYEVSALNVTGNLTLGNDAADVLSVTTERINISDGNVYAAGNLTIGEKITFSLGQIIDNLVNGFLRVSGKLNVTGNVSIGGDTLFVDNTSGRVGIGTAIPVNKLTVIGDVSAFGSLNATFINATEIRVGANIVQVEKDSFKTANYSAEYAATGFDRENATDYIGGDNASLLRAINISKDLAKFFSNFNLGNVSNDTLRISGNASIALWNSTTLTNAISGILMYPRDSNSSLIIGFGFNSSKNVSDALTVIGSAAVYGSLNATFINATEIRQGLNQVQTINAVYNLGNYSAEYALTGFKIANYSDAYAASGFKRANITEFLGVDNASLIRIGNFTDLFLANYSNEYARSGFKTANYSAEYAASGYKTANYSAEYAATGFDRENATDYIGGDNASLLRTINISRDIAKSFSNFQLSNVSNNTLVKGDNATLAQWNANGNNIFNKNSGNVGVGTSAPATTLDVKGKANFTGNFSIMNASDTIFFVDNTSGYVGIGTANPRVKLHIVSSGLGNDGFMLRLNKTAGSTGENYLQMVGDTQNWDIGIGENTDPKVSNTFNIGRSGINYDFIIDSSGRVGIAYNQTGTAQLAINGNVGIGTTSPLLTLHVNGTGADGGFLVTNGSGSNYTAFYVNSSSGFVGIGNSNPASRLDIKKTDQIAQFGEAVGSATGGGNWIRIIGQANNYDIGVAQSLEGGYWFLSDTVNYKLVLRDGNIGIGTTTPDNLLAIMGNEITANAILHLNASDNYNDSVINVITLDHVLKSGVNSTGRAGVSILFRATDNASQIYNIGNISAVLYNATNGSQLGALTFSTSGADTGDNSFGHLLERMRIDGYGRVGIGTTAPMQKLEVAGNIFVNNTLNAFLNLSGPVLRKSGSDIVISD